MKHLTVQQLAERLANGSPPVIIDVREPHEYQLARIDGAILKPLGQIFSWAEELDKQQEYVLQCHTGVRSFQAALVLERLGFTNVANLTGGIDAWSMQIDPRVPRY